MPKGNGSRPVRKEKVNNLVAVQDYLAAKSITAEKVLDFVCFEYKNQHHRVRSISDVKIIMGIGI